jgi:dTDP-4-amino-4,6-dideoxygalactose transaminase
MIDFNLPYLSGKEEEYIFEAVRNGKISGNGKFTQLCHKIYEERFGFNKVLLTTSCTDALEMSALLCNINEGDEVIVPSYTFVSSALAFVRERAKVVFADSLPDHPNIDASKIEALITPRTKAIVVVHYSGVACDMDPIMEIAKKHDLYVVEDAAQAIDSAYKGKFLGTIGDFGTFSFHETKNIQCGEGGLLGINSKQFQQRAEIMWEKGTNRAEFFRGDVNKYGWVDIGSSFLPSDSTSAYLYAQLEALDKIQSRRKQIWNRYNDQLSELGTSGVISLPAIPEYATNNAHMYYLVAENPDERTAIIKHLRANDIHAVFHYLALHRSTYYSDKHDGRSLPNAVKFEEQLIRLPFYAELRDEQVDYICDSLKSYYS